MNKIVIVGDEPSNLNISPNIAFVGAKCFPTLVEWIKHLDPDYYVCLNSNTLDAVHDIKTLYTDGFKVIAVGNKASERLTFSGVKHFKLPHPSGLNRQMNDKAFVLNQLNLAKYYISQD